jgi:tetratricopeptide (TPR) repeat protein
VTRAAPIARLAGVSVAGACLAALLWAGAAAAAEHVAIRAAPHPGYGRIVFDWTRAAAHEAKLDGRTLTIRFARPFVAPLARIKAALPDYVADATLGPDGRTVRVALKGDYRLHVFDDQGGAAVFDLRSPKTPAVQTGGAPTLPVRTGTHDGFGRLVFDWKTPVGMKVDEGKGSATIRFDRAARVDIGRLSARLPAPIAAIRQESGKGLVLALRVPEGARLRHFTSGTSVVLDVLTPARQEAERGPPAPKREPVAEKPSVPKGRQVPKPEPVAAPAALGPPTRLGPPPRSTPAAERRVIEREAVGPGGAGLVSVDVEHERDISSFRFNWRRPVAAATFRRRGKVWVVFDTPARIDVAALAVLGKPLVKSAAQVPVVGGTAVQLEIDPAYRLRVRAEGTVWAVDAVSGLAPENKGIRVLPQGSLVGGDARIVLPVPEPGQVLRLHDPDVGDMVQVVPLAEAGRGVAARHWFVDVAVLQSAQGVAVHPLADGVVATSTATGVTITRPGGLRLSSVTDRVRAARAPPPPVERLFDLLAWAKGPGKTPAESREILSTAAAEAVPGRRTAARLRLARYFVARGFGPEALGVVAQIMREDPALANHASLVALRGAAYYLAGEYGPAAAELAIPIFANNVEAGPWRGAIAAARGDWTTAQREFADLETATGQYPPWLATRFGLLAAESSLAVGDTGAAAARLEVLADRGLVGADHDMLDVLQGYYLKDTGDADGALKLWRSVAEHGDRRTAARARFALADALLGKKEITLVQAIDRMERLRFAWRGDAFEFDVLRRLAELYGKRDDSRDALETLKEAATYFHDIEGVEAVAKEMAAIFRHLFAEGGADKLPPVTALALFDEFRELTPSGPEGDAMVRKLAERLVTVDLLGDAARLLDQQVRFRLKGVEKARVGARLAAVRLLDKKPKDALAALDESTGPDLPADLAHERRLARARALAGLDRRAAALATLVGDASLAAERLRAHMAWRAKDWPAAAAAFDRLIARTDPPPAPEDRARLVLSRAVALALAGDAASLAALRDSDADAMKKTKYAAAFAAVVGPASPDGIRAAIALAGDIGAVETLLGESRGGAAPARAAIN